MIMIYIVKMIILMIMTIILIIYDHHVIDDNENNEEYNNDDFKCWELEPDAYIPWVLQWSWENRNYFKYSKPGKITKKGIVH